MLDPLYHCRKYLTPMHYLYKSQFKPREEYCCHICVGAAQPSLSSRDRLQPCNPVPTGKTLLTSSLSLLLRQMFKRANCLFLPAQTFTARTRHSTYMVSNLPLSLRIILARSKFTSDRFSPRTVTL